MVMGYSSHNSEPCSITVVIATLGGDTLSGTIEAVNRGSIVPEEILVCIPEEYANRTAHLNYANLRVIKTKCRGQVAQRAEGFFQAKGAMVLQLDDDIQLCPGMIFYLVSALEVMGEKNAVGPVYVDVLTKRSIHLIESGVRGWAKNIFYTLACGARWGRKRMGTFTPAGVGFGVDPACLKVDLFSTEWLPGGCVLSYKEDLVGTNFFPYKGKAYCEDFIHSHLRTVEGIGHWVVPAAVCLINRPESEASCNEQVASVRARRYFVNLSGRSLTRLRLYELVAWVIWFIK